MILICKNKNYDLGYLCLEHFQSQNHYKVASILSLEAVELTAPLNSGAVVLKGH